MIRPGMQALVPRAAPLGTQILKAPVFKPPASSVFVVGCGPISVLLMKDLAQAGVKVIAGVPDAEEAEAVMAFAKRYELLASSITNNIRVVEVDYTDEEDVVRALPRGSKVVLVENDVFSVNNPRSRVDANVVTAMAEAAEAAQAGGLVLISGAPGGSMATGFSLFGGGRPASPSSSPRLSRSEEAVVAAEALPQRVVVRVPNMDRSTSLLPGVAVARLGTAGGAPPAGRAQAASVLSTLLASAGDGTYMVEVVGNEEAVPVEDQVRQLMLQIREENEAAALATAKEAAAAQQQAREKASRSGTRSSATIFGIGMARPALQEEEVVEVVEVKTPARRPFFAFGSKKPVQVEEEEEEEEVEAPPPKRSWFAFGRKQAVQEEEEEEEEVEEVAEEPRRRPFFAFGGGRGAPIKEEEEEEEAPAARGATRRGFFGFGGGKPQEEEEEEPEEVQPRRRSFFAFGGPSK